MIYAQLQMTLFYFSRRVDEFVLLGHRTLVAEFDGNTPASIPIDDSYAEQPQALIVGIEKVPPDPGPSWGT